MKRILIFFLSALFLVSGCASFTGNIKSGILSYNNKPKKGETIYPWFVSGLNKHEAPHGVSINAGYSKIKITPLNRVYLAGFYPVRTSSSVHDDLWAKCLVLEDMHHEYVVIVTTDLIGLLPDTINSIRKKIKPFVNPEKVFLTSTHTHSGPDTMGLWGEGLLFPSLSDGKDKKYMMMLENKIAGVIKSAMKNRTRAKLRFANGVSPGLAVGRKNNLPDETITTLQVIFDNLPLGGSVSLVNFSMHPDAVYSRYVTADFVYFLTQKLEASTGGQVMYINGAIGGVQPSILGWMGAEKLGENLASNIFKTFEKYTIPASSTITSKRIFIKVPLKNTLFRIAHVLGMIPDFRDEFGNVDVELNYINICGAKVLTVPGELFPSIWERLKNRIPGNTKMLWGLTNGELGYILSRYDFESGDHSYHASVSVGPDMGERTEDALLEIIK